MLHLEEWLGEVDAQRSTFPTPVKGSNSNSRTLSVPLENCTIKLLSVQNRNFSFELKLCKWVVWIPSQNKFNNLTDKNEIQNCLPGKDLVFCWSLQWEEPWHLGGIPHTVKLPVKRQKGPDMLYRKCRTVYDDQHFRFGPDCLSACGVG